MPDIQCLWDSLSFSFFSLLHNYSISWRQLHCIGWQQATWTRRVLGGQGNKMAITSQIYNCYGMQETFPFRHFMWILCWRPTPIGNKLINYLVISDVFLINLKVLNFWKFTSYCSLKPLWLDMGEVVPARTSPTLHPPSPPTVHQLSWLTLLRVKYHIKLLNNNSTTI